MSTAPAEKTEVRTPAKAGGAQEAPAAKPKASKKVRKTVPEAHIYVTASFNNTLITATDSAGNTLITSSAGGCGFKGSRRSTPYAATVTAEKLIEKLKPYGVEKVKIFVKGVGTGREQAIRGLQAGGFDLHAIFDITPMPHNGCRKKKSRRV